MKPASITHASLLAALGLFVGRAMVQPAPPPEARQFDFWVGEWEVFTPAGSKAGENRIEHVAGGWGVLESWSGTGGYTGRSLNTWRSDQRQWQQFWVGTGDVLELAGGLNAKGEMVLESRTTGNGGKETRHRITWTPNPDGTVRQLWISSADGAATWTTAFDGLYRRKPR